jgi:hypothetical protein
LRKKWKGTSTELGDRVLPLPRFELLQKFQANLCLSSYSSLNISRHVQQKFDQAMIAADKFL